MRGCQGREADLLSEEPLSLLRLLRGGEIRGQWGELILGIEALYRGEVSGFLFQVCHNLWLA